MPELSANEVAELACVYAALILHDEKIGITADKIKAIVAAAGVEVPPFWPSLFAKVLEKKNIDDIILHSGGGGGGSAPAQATHEKKDDGKKDAGKKEEKKEEKKKKEEPKEEEDEDMGFGLFD